MKRTGPPKRKRRLSPVGRRAEREREALEAFRANPPETCERCGERRRVDAHHRLPRSRGGEHTPENRSWLCRPCHRGVHERRDDWRDWLIVGRLAEHDMEEETDAD
ncbi:MAG: hypothetical protein CMH55_07605 [Myxococcales bacterium]|nr:hypothetical protein [Myxococcales bacterium]